MDQKKIDKKLEELEHYTLILDEIGDDSAFIEEQIIQIMLENNLTEMIVNGKKVKLVDERKVENGKLPLRKRRNT